MTNLLMVGVFLLGSVTGGEVHTQKMNIFPLGTWENGDQLLWSGAKVGDQMELATEVKKDGTYRLKIVLTKAPDYGTVQFALDGKKVGGQIDLFSTWIGVTPPIPLGDVTLTAGKHKLTITLAGKNKRSKGTKIGIDQVLLVPKADLPAPTLDEPGQLDELGDLSLLPRLRPGSQTEMSSSYDKTGKNDDGFSGEHSKLWVEDGNTVIAVVDGPGVVERMVFTHSLYHKRGLLGRKGEHIRFYLDGNEKPAIDIPIEELFSGKHPLFPAPLAGENQGGCYCYVPIAYRDGCKIEVDGTGIKFYHITFTKLPTAEGISTFSGKMGPRQQKSFERMKRLWANLGDPAALKMKDVEWTDVDLSLPPGMEKKIELPAGRRMVRAVLLEGEEGQLDATRNAKIEFSWDGAKKPAIDLSTEFFFCRVWSKIKNPSLLTGANDQGWYNFMPMPYHESGSVIVRAVNAPVFCKLRVATVPIAADVDLKTLGYLHSAYNDMPVKRRVHHQFAKRKGTGHYLGTYMATRGSNAHNQPSWLEGDEYFIVDGKLVIHGTGSEDYFNCGWYSTPGRLDHPGGKELGGFSVFRHQEKDKKKYSITTSYRWHVADPVPFEKQLDAKIEHGAGNGTKAEYRSSAFYYETTP